MVKTLDRRYFSLDIARVIAIWCVCLVHSSSDLMSVYKPGTPGFFIFNVLNGGGRIAVPLYLMISGALFLDEKKQFTIKGLLQKNVKPLIIIALVWSAIYAVALPMMNGQSIGIKTFIRSTLYGPYHMWYLYMVSLLYIATPLLKKFVNQENSKMVLVFIGVSMAVKFSIPALKMLYRLGINLKIVADLIDQAYPDFFDGHVAYYLAGWYIVHVGIKQKWQKIAVYVLGILAYVAMVLYVQYTGDIKHPYYHLGLVVFMFSVALFVALNSVKLQPNAKIAAIVAFFSKLSFGVYLVHVLVLEVCKKFIIDTSHPILYIFGLSAAVAAGSFLVSFIISKIPVVKKMIKA